MTWKEALEHAKMGKKIRRPRWMSDYYVSLNLETLIWQTQDEASWHPTLDVLGYEWELFEPEEEKPKIPWKCCKEDAIQSSTQVPIRRKTWGTVEWIGYFDGNRDLRINCIKVADPENYEYCELEP